MPAPLPRLGEFMLVRLSVASNAVSSIVAGEYCSRFGLKTPDGGVMAVLGG